jgi:hypothetical protein
MEGQLMARRIKITNEGTLLSVELDREITPNQASIIQSVLKDESLTYGEVLRFLADRRAAQEYADTAALDYMRLFQS